MKRRLTALFLALSMLFVLTACGGKHVEPTTDENARTQQETADNGQSTEQTAAPEDTGKKDKKKNKDEKKNKKDTGKSSKSSIGSKPTPTPTPKPAATPTPKPTTAPTPTPTPAPTPTPKAKTFCVGVTLNGVYENDYFGIACRPSGEWAFFPAEQLISMNDVSIGLTNEDYKALIDSGSSMIDMYAAANEGMLSMNASIQKLPDAGMTEAQYLDAAREMTDFESSYMEQGFTSVSVTRPSVSFLGATHDSILISASAVVDIGEIEEFCMYQQMVPIIRDGYVLLLTFVCVGDNIINSDMMGYFFAP